MYVGKKGDRCPVCETGTIQSDFAHTCGVECGVKFKHRDDPDFPLNVAVDKPKNSREDEHTKDAWIIRMTSDRVKNEADFVKACNIDLEIWEIDRLKVRSYEVTYVPRATRKNDTDGWIRNHGNAVTIPMFALEATLVKRADKKIRSGDRVAYLEELRRVLADDKFEFSTRPLPKFPAPVDRGHHEIAVVLSSDQHLTETVRPEDANGVNVYNSIICANRLWEHAQKVKTILRRHMSLYTIDKIVSFLLGDVVNGTIHQEYVASNDLSDVAAVTLGARLMYMFYKELATIGLPIEIEAVHGNHARLTPKMPTKRQAHTNLDWQLYEWLSDKLAGEDGIDLKITTAQIGTRKLYDWNYVYEHGINVSSGREEDFEDRVRALLDDPTFREATGYKGASYDQIVIGNMHKPKFLERTVVNGSYIGQNELGQSWRLKPIKAQQLMWGVSQKHVRTWQYAVDLTAVKHARNDNPFSEYAAWFLKKHGQ